MNRPDIKRQRTLATIAFALAAAPLAMAQVTPIEEVTVTARKRAETLQEVPMAVSAIDGVQIARLALQDVEDLYGRVPGLYFTTVGGASPNSDFQYLQIRGVGFNGGLEPAVGVFIDGMYMPQLGFDLGFLDVERIEVLRGPQGTLFGRNTQAGALNIVTQRPDEEFRGRVEGEVAEFGTYRVRAAVSGALADNFFGSVNVEYGETDGFVDNIPQGTDQNFSEQIAARVNLRWEATENLEFQLIADVSDRDFRDAGTSVLLTPDEDYDSFADQDTDDEKQTSGIQLKIDWDINETMTLTSLTGYRRAESEISYDPDFNITDQTAVTFGAVTQSTSTPTVPIGVAPNPITIDGTTHDTGLDQEYFSQEIQLAGATDQIDWLAGFYYFDQSIDQTRAFDIGPGVPFLPLYIREAFTEDRDGFALYGQVSYRPTEQLEITAGARYSEEDVVKGGQRVLNILDAIIFAFPTDGENDFDNVSFTGSIAYDFNDDLHGYVTYSEGWKAGGINRFPSRDNAILGYDDEESSNLEFGLKSSWLDGRITANAAVFFIDIEGQQVLTVVPDPGGATPVTIIDNAADSSSEGFELELGAQLGEYFFLDLSYSGTMTEFDEYFLNDGAGVPTVDKSGDEFQFVPNDMGSATLSFRNTLKNDANIDISVNYRYVGGYLLPDGSLTANLGDELRIPSYDRLDARAIVDWNDWRFTAYVDNIADSFDYNNLANDLFIGVAGGTYVTPLEPRQFGLIVSKSF